MAVESIKFKELDTQPKNAPDGKLNAAEVYQGLRKYNKKVTEDDAKAFIDWADQDDDDQITVQEFSAAVKHYSENMSPEKQAKLDIKVWDNDKDGKVSKDELKQTGFNDFDVVDEDKDGFVTEKELAAFQKKVKKVPERKDDPYKGKAMPNTVEAVAEEELSELIIEQQKKDSQALRSLQGKSLLPRMKARSMPRVARHPSQLALGSSWVGPSVAGLLIVPLLVAAFSCRRRFRGELVEQGASALIDEDAEE